MIIYSPIPIEYIMEGFENQGEPLQEIHINGIVMQVQPMNHFQAKVIRIISPNPQDYLNPNYYPGQMIRFQPSTSGAGRG